MGAEPGSPRRLGASVLLVLGLVLLGRGMAAGQPPQPSAADAGPGSAMADVPGAPPLPASPPVRIRIPAIGVDAPLTGLGLDAAGHLATPPTDRPGTAGWYSGGPTPGTTGPAIIAGHVDNAHGPAVFYGLGAVHTGDTVDVERRDHRTAEFTVDAVEVYPRSDFPDRLVYGRTDNPELRLITCGGGYTRATGYLGNVVVFAHLTGPDG
ncbi:class F sortase [Streptacidiphilus sp. P02-A3a]|uniref:class F sortase n=1 Tax=Streptacidiphilus sp. P02-A3a TaxID=2704468 RepID=UPI0015F9B442|nr:class F sortase [Streptacidiphilus sp. P02-A3a]